MTTFTQSTSAFSTLGDTDLVEGDEIVFTKGMVDIHSHGRDNNDTLGQGMTDILSHSTKQFGLALLMPNLAGKDALMTPQMSIDYYDRARRAVEYEMDFLVTVYLNTNLTEDDIKMIASDPRIAGIKSYPAHGTTNSEQGLRTPLEAAKQLEWMQKYRVPLIVHGQVRTNSSGKVMDEYGREMYFYEHVAPLLDDRYPALRISYEHISTGVGARAVIDRKGPTMGTFTCLHLLETRTTVMDTGVRTDMVMKPMVQPEEELALLWAALQESPQHFALGSDDAWHPIAADPPMAAKFAKNSACGGCYGSYRVGYYLDAFERNNAHGLFGGFACVNAANFYEITIPDRTVRLRKCRYKVAESLPFGKYEALPLYAGEERLGWKLIDS